MARNLVLLGSLAIICLLGFLTVLVAFRQGVDVLVVLSLIVLGVLAFGVLGAISSPARDD